MNPLVINRPVAILLPLFVLFLKPLKSQHFSFTEVPDVWYNTQLSPEILKSYRYASVDVHLVNPAAFSQLKFFPPKPKNGKAKKDWERKYDHLKEMKYLCANVIFPAAKSPWNTDLKIPLYLLDLDGNSGFYENGQSANVLNRVPRQNMYFNRLEAGLKLENIGKKQLVNYASAIKNEIAQVANFVEGNPMAGSAEFAKALQRKGGDFSYQVGMKEKYEFNYDLQLYSLGDYDDGIIQQIDVYTIVPSDLGNKNYPKLDKTITGFKSIEEVKKMLNKDENSFPQFLVVYRIHQHNYKYFNTIIAEEVIQEQSDELKKLTTYEFISEEESELWNDLLTLKKMILSMDVNAISPYYTHLQQQQSYTADLMNIIEAYRGINLKLKEFQHKYQDSELYHTHFRNHFNTMRRKADSYLLNTEKKPSLEKAYYFVQALLERRSQEPLSQTADKYKAVQKLDYLKREAIRMKAQGEAGFIALENSPYYDLADLHVLVLEKEIYKEKYQQKVNALGKRGEKGSTYAELSSIMENNTEACSYCKKQIKRSLAKYQSLRAQKEMEAIRGKYQYIKRNIPNEVLSLKNEAYCVERILDSPNFITVNGGIVKDYKSHLFSLRDQLVKLENLTRQEVNTSDKTALTQFHEKYDSILKQINNLRFIFEERQGDFGTCFSSGGEIRP